MKRSAKPLILFSLCAAFLGSGPAQSASPTVLTRMFSWWNGAIKTPGAFTPDSFRRYFTNDAALVIDGVEAARGLPALAAHFGRIQASGADVRIILPFEHEMQQGNLIYTYHVIRSMRAGVPGCMLAAGHAIVSEGRIAEISLVRTALKPGTPIFTAKCP
jgi:hypothetical protein